MMKKNEKPWGGRFSEPTDREVEAFTASIHFDRRLYRYDIEGSIAHARMLAKQGIITKGEAKAILTGLRGILAEIEAGNFAFHPDDEDIHMAIEKALTARIGETGGKLHTGRSRNDQIALDIRLYLRAEIGRVVELLGALKTGFVELAKKEMGRDPARLHPHAEGAAGAVVPLPAGLPGDARPGRGDVSGIA